jgi:hypothetical protein
VPEFAGCEACAAAGASAGGGEDCPAVCWAAALSVTSKNAVTIPFQVRITLFLSYFSIRQLENHMHDRRGIHGLTVAQRSLETHLVGSGDRSLIEAVTHAAHHAIHVQ